MMDFIEEHHFSGESSSTSFVNTDLEDFPMSLWEPSRPMHVPLNIYGRPTAAILPTRRNDNHGTTAINRPLPTYPNNFAVNNSGFQTQKPVELGHQPVHRPWNNTQARLVNPNSAFTSNRSNLPMYNNAPLMIQIPPHEGNSHIPELNGGPNPVSLPNFPFQVGHSTNLLLLPTHERQMYRLLPTVMPSVTGFCDFMRKMVRLDSVGDSGGKPRCYFLRRGDSQRQGSEVPRLHERVRGCAVLF